MAASLTFRSMGEVRLRQWVDANPGRINDRDSDGYTPLHAAACCSWSVPLVLWLVTEKGADVNAADEYGCTPLHLAESIDVLKALLDCGVDPALPDSGGRTLLMNQLLDRRYDLAACLLQDLRVQAGVNVQGRGYVGLTALHLVTQSVDKPEVPAIIQLLLKAGADPTLKIAGELTPLHLLQHCHPAHPTTLALVAQSLDAERASFLVKARRLVMAATRTTPPSFLQGRVACGLPLPRVALAPVTDDQNNDELRSTLAFVVGMEGGGMPRDVFRSVLELIMPFWDPLRRSTRGGGGGGGHSRPE